MALACAGHPAPVVRRADGCAAMVNVGGSLTGVFRQLEKTASTAYPAPVDALILCTDGVSEARRNGRLFGDEVILDVIAQCEPSVDSATPKARSGAPRAVTLGHGGAA